LQKNREVFSSCWNETIDKAAQSSSAGVSEEETVINQVAGKVPRQRLMDQGGDLERNPVE